MESNSTLQNALKADKLEEILVANWTQFIDSSKLLGFVVKTVQSNIERLAIISSAQIKPRGISATVSRCHWNAKGFLIWVEFHVPTSTNKIAEGTMELNLSNDGSIYLINILGNVYCIN